MEVAGNAKFPNVLISKLEYINWHFLNNDPLGKTEVNFSALKDFFTYRLNFKDKDLLENFVG